jgi:hypothetical protein
MKKNTVVQVWKMDDKSLSEAGNGRKFTMK